MPLLINAISGPGPAGPGGRCAGRWLRLPRACPQAHHRLPERSPHPENAHAMECFDAPPFEAVFPRFGEWIREIWFETHQGRPANSQFARDAFLLHAALSIDDFSRPDRHFFGSHPLSPHVPPTRANLRSLLANQPLDSAWPVWNLLLRFRSRPNQTISSRRRIPFVR
jgi:hypothetical protein